MKKFYILAVVLFFLNIISNILIAHFQNLEAEKKENARADVISLLYEERIKRRKDSIEYNEIIEQLSDAYYKHLDTCKNH